MTGVITMILPFILNGISMILIVRFLSKVDLTTDIGVDIWYILSVGMIVFYTFYTLLFTNGDTEPYIEFITLSTVFIILLLFMLLLDILNVFDNAFVFVIFVFSSISATLMYMCFKHQYIYDTFFEFL